MDDPDIRRVHRDELLRELNELHLAAGGPTLKRMVKMADEIKSRENGEDWRRPSEATFSNLMTGKGVRTPNWPLVRTTVTALYWLGAANGKWSTPTPQEASRFTKRFADLWEAAERESRGTDKTARPAAHVPGDILEQRPEEVRLPLPPRSGFRMPRSWGRIGAAILRRAEEGDPVAAYQAAVLLAAEAARDDVLPDYRESLFTAAAEWQRRAVGDVAEALTLRLSGRPLLTAARNLAFGRATGSRRNVIFIQALLHVEHALQREGDRAIPDRDRLT
ncbi:hypothetical protein [Herbidospora sp. RD11066]